MGKSLSSAIVVCLLTASTASADVQLQLQNGRVSIVAKDATVRQILAEWARVGQTKVVNGDRVPGGPLTIELNNIPEGQALDVLLRSVSGYMAAPRETAVANLSVFDRIIVMPTAAAPRPAVSAAPSGPVFQQPQFTPAAPPPPDDDPDDRPAANVQMPQPPRPPIFNAFPPPQVGGPGVVPVQGGQPAQPAPVFGSAPTAPSGGVAVPGMVVPAPVPPGTVTSPGNQPPVPGQVVRPTGRSGGPGGH
jgi:hypothetical protein